MNGAVESRLAGKQLVFIDTNCIIYHISGDKNFSPIVAPIFDRIDKGAVQGLGSFITLLEVLVLPYRMNDMATAQAYKNILTTARNFRLFPVDRQIADAAARLRAQHGALKTPDAILVATALNSKADIFVTNDGRIKNIPGLNILDLSNP